VLPKITSEPPASTSRGSADRRGGEMAKPTLDASARAEVAASGVPVPSRLAIWASCSAVSSSLSTVGDSRKRADTGVLWATRLRARSSRLS
jgi:hypothetical protein